MKRLALAGLCLLALAGEASAQQADPRPVDAATADRVQAGDVPAPMGSVAPNLQPDVTVHGRSLREPCKPRDQACIRDVSAEIWRRYPKQIETLCTNEQIYRFKEGMILADQGVEGANLGRESPQTEALCRYGAEMKRRQKQQAAADTPPPDAPAAAPGTP